MIVTTPIVEWNDIYFWKVSSLTGWKQLVRLHPDILFLLYNEKERKALLCGKDCSAYFSLFEDETDDAQFNTNEFISGYMTEYIVNRLACTLFKERVDELYGFKGI